jgi:Tat protein translocase TatB subunit
MDFFGIGILEIILILVVALIIVGPGKLPGIARTMGKTVRAIRRASSELTTAVTRELEAEEKAEKAQKQTAVPAPGTALSKKSSIPEGSPTRPGKATSTK